MTHALLLFALAAANCVEVDGPRITAANIPALAALPPSTDLGFAPAFGARRVLRAGDQEICVVRRGRVLRREKVLNAMRNSLPDGAQLELIDLDANPVPAGELVFPASGLHGEHWRGYVRSADRTSVPVQAAVRVTTTRKRAFAVREIAVGETIESGAIEIREERVSGIASGRANDENVAGKVAVGRIPAGAAIEARMLRPRPAVAAGDLVSVTVLGGPATLRFETRSQSSARLGDTLLVRSPLNGSLVRAKVAGERSAVVEATR